MFNKQKIFTKVKNHLLKQNEKSSKENDNNNCQYKIAKNGKILKCAIGCLISDKFYSSKMEDRGIYGLLQLPNDIKSNILRKSLKQSLKVENLSNENLYFLWDLQQIHDDYRVSQWSIMLQNFAKKHELKYE